jgi:drug/metabolite transporter (DMT)-like permease
MAIAMGGAFVLVGPSFGLGERALLGDALGVVTAMFYGAYMLAVKHLREARSTAHIMAVSTTVCAVALLPLALVSGETMWPATTAGWLTLFGLALVCQTAGQSLIAYAMAHLPASFSSVSLLLQPAMATLYAWAILGERAGLAQLAGGAVILAGIWLARKGS